MGIEVIQPRGIPRHRGLNHVKVCGKGFNDGLEYNLFVINNEPILQTAYFLKIFKYEEVIGYKRTESEIRIEALAKLRELQQSEQGKYYDFVIKEVRDEFDAVVGTAWKTKKIWSNGSWC